MNFVDVKNLFVEYKSSSPTMGEKTVYAVSDLSLSVNQGEVYSIAGESGCGKSTFLKAFLRLVPSKSGEINFEGVDILKMDKKALKDFRCKAQMIFQNPYASLNPKMTVFDTLKEPLEINFKGLKKEDYINKVKEIAKSVGLKDEDLKKYPHEFSGGQRQRIAIARALILKPALVLADEPVSALDVSIQGQIINLLNELKSSLGLTFIFISHDLNVIKYISDRVGIMYLGEMVEEGLVEDIFDNPKHPYTQALLSANPNSEKEKIILQGELPSPLNPPTGCKFHTRCPFAKEICKTQKPKTTNFSNDHYAKCHLFT